PTRLLCYGPPNGGPDTLAATPDRTPAARPSRTAATLEAIARGLGPPAMTEADRPAFAQLLALLGETFHEPTGGARASLRARNLACACPLDLPCHVEVWLEVATSHDPSSRLARCDANGARAAPARRGHRPGTDRRSAVPDFPFAATSGGLGWDPNGYNAGTTSR